MKNPAARPQEVVPVSVEIRHTVGNSFIIYATAS